MLMVEIEREADGRWLAEVPVVPAPPWPMGRRARTRRPNTALALRALAERIDHGEPA